jgi:uncharacterized protein YbcI
MAPNIEGVQRLPDPDTDMTPSTPGGHRRRWLGWRRVDNDLMPAIKLAGEMLSEVANAVSKTKADFFGRGPEGGKAYLNDDLLVVVLRGGLLDVEETLIQRGRADKVRDLRVTWQEELDDEITQQIERITGLKVLDYHSQILVRERVIVELFLIADA